jgi:asparagine synthase (glutamine-hydrolysing)
MCGLAGYFGQGNREILEKMTRALKYRGPDDEGFFISDQIGLGHRRLSIIDLSQKGRQPLSNEDKTIYLIFNGEIYNFQNLKKDLIERGHKFESQTDSEVIVHQYEEDGVDCFKKFNGMFAIAIWDSQQQKLILARDRYGQKPLYWSQVNDTLVFTSELKAILLHPLIKKELNHLAVYQYFSFDYVPQPLTIFKNIHKLENSTFLVFQNNQIKINNYYQIRIEPEEIDFHSALMGLEKLLKDAIQKRLIADVPLGIFLSGGIDSSTIAYFAKEQKKEIKTFSIGFSESSFDESFYAQQVAKLLKTEHYHREFKPEDLLAIIPEVIDNLDEPFGDPSILPTYLLSKFTRERVKVALGGDGGDELLMGYPNHQVQKLVSLLKLYQLRLRGNYGKILERLLPVSDRNLTFSYKAKRYGHSLAFSGLYRDFLNIGSYFSDIDKLFKFEIKPEELFGFVNSFLKDYQDKNYLDQVSLLFLKYYLEDDILFKVDRASMYNSLEVRAPFLDFQLADFVNSLPLNYKLRGLKTKYILKKLMEGRLPKKIVYRKKKGFGVPLTAWLRKDLKKYMLENLDRSEIDKLGLINYQTVAKLIKDHLGKKADNRKVIWNLIIFQHWARNHLC